MLPYPITPFAESRHKSRHKVPEPRTEFGSSKDLWHNTKAMALPINVGELIENRVVESTRIEYKSDWDPEPIVYSGASKELGIQNVRFAASDFCYGRIDDRIPAEDDHRDGQKLCQSDLQRKRGSGPECQPAGCIQIPAEGHEIPG